MSLRILLIAALLLSAFLAASAAPVAADDDPHGPMEPCLSIGWCVNPKDVDGLMGVIRDALTCTCPPL